MAARAASRSQDVPLPQIAQLRVDVLLGSLFGQPAAGRDHVGNRVLIIDVSQSSTMAADRSLPAKMPS